MIATGTTTPQLRKQNKLHRTNTLLHQPHTSQWQVHNSSTLLTEDHWDNRLNMAEVRETVPQGLALRHEAVGLLAEWAQFGCPTRTGQDWSLAEIQAAIDRGPHQSALKPNAIGHFAEEVSSKVTKGQARVVFWDDIKSNHPKQLKVSPVAAIPHKLQAYRSILDLSFKLRLEDGGVAELVNNTMLRSCFRSLRSLRSVLRSLRSCLRSLRSPLRSLRSPLTFRSRILPKPTPFFQKILHN